jgi:proline iminopeptidase
MATSKLVINREMIKKADGDAFALAFARIECHYFINKGFFTSDEWILENVEKLNDIPIVIVQGRYDVVCPLRSAWDLKKKIPNAELIITHAGHSATEM